MQQLVTIFGGSGFVGRYIARRMAKAGWRVRVAVRRPNEAHFVRMYGAVGQVEPVFANIRDDTSVEAALMGADAVVNCVGILAEAGKNGFDSVQAEGAERVARIAAAMGIDRMVQLSAIGADDGSESDYARTKAQGYRPPAYWDRIAEVKSALTAHPTMKVVANGEIFSVADAARCREVTGCDDLMIGRGMVTNPGLALAIKAQGSVSWAEIVPLLGLFWAHVVERVERRHRSGRLKQWLNYLRDHYPEAQSAFDDLRLTNDVNHIETWLLTHGAIVVKPGSDWTHALAGKAPQSAALALAC